jgi:hypothetical protein
MTTSKRTTRRTHGAPAVDGTDSQPPTDASAATSPSKPRRRRTKSPPPAAPRHREERHASIAKAAYFRSQHRGFIPGYELEDWLAAEEEVDQRLTGEDRVS